MVTNIDYYLAERKKKIGMSVVKSESFIFKLLLSIDKQTWLQEKKSSDIYSFFVSLAISATQCGSCIYIYIVRQSVSLEVYKPKAILIQMQIKICKRLQKQHKIYVEQRFYISERETDREKRLYQKVCQTTATSNKNITDTNITKPKTKKTFLFWRFQGDNIFVHNNNSKNMQKTFRKYP